MPRGTRQTYVTSFVAASCSTILDSLGSLSCGTVLIADIINIIIYGLFINPNFYEVHFT